MKSKRKTAMTKLKELFKDSPEILDVFDNAIERGFLNKSGKPTRKNLLSNVDVYCKFLATGRGTPKIVRTKLRNKRG